MREGESESEVTIERDRDRGRQRERESERALLPNHYPHPYQIEREIQTEWERKIQRSSFYSELVKA